MRDNIGHLLDWISNNESLLSGIAAAIAIAAVLLGLGSWALRLVKLRKDRDGADADAGEAPLRQDIRYCRLPNGRRIAWSSAGDGYPLVRSLGWFTNLEMEWESPEASRFWQNTARRFRLVRYDGRGMGLSDREVDGFSSATRLEDLEAVVEASGLQRFALMGLSEGGSTAIRYAAKYPERVSHLVIWGSFLVAIDPDDAPQFGAIARLVPEQWGGTSDAFHQMFAAMFLPDGDAAQNRLFRALQRSSATPQTAFDFIRSINDVDVRDIAGNVQVPTLVLHRKGDLVSPVKYGREIAATMPNAQLALLEGNNHWMISDCDDLGRILDRIEAFIRN